MQAAPVHARFASMPQTEREALLAQLTIARGALERCRDRLDAWDEAHPTGPDRGRRIRQARKDLGLTQRQLAHKAGLSPSTIHHAEQGRMPTLRTILALLDALEVSSEWLAYGEETTR